MDKNTGDHNTGNCNTGNCNTGNRNTGDWNTGNYNTGYWNTGNYNTGNRNTDNWNTGDRNTGDNNTGDNNTGDCNTGDCNTGNCNTGNCNTGNRNTGDWNTGYWNTGDYNTGNYNTGFFNTETPTPTFFDQPTDLTWKEAYNRIPEINLKPLTEWVETKDMTDQEKRDNPTHTTTGGYLRVNKPLREQFKGLWPTLPQETKDRFLSLPNFNAQKFLECTGVDVRVPETAPTPGQESIIVLDGIRYAIRRID